MENENGETGLGALRAGDPVGVRGLFGYRNWTQFTVERVTGKQIKIMGVPFWKESGEQATSTRYRAFAAALDHVLDRKDGETVEQRIVADAFLHERGRKGMAARSRIQDVRLSHLKMETLIGIVALIEKDEAERKEEVERLFKRLYQERDG